MALRTLDDMRKLLRHLPKDRREMSTWQHAAAELDKAAAGADPLGVSIALRMVLMLERVEFGHDKPRLRLRSTSMRRKRVVSSSVEKRTDKARALR